MRLGTSLVIAAAILLTACRTNTAEDAEQGLVLATSSGPKKIDPSDLDFTHVRLPGAQAWDELYDYASVLQDDLEQDPDSYTFNSSSGGTSVYMEVKGKGKAGALLVENGATKVTGEIFAFTMSRLLGFSNIVGSKAHCNLSGKGIAVFEKLVNGLASSNKIKKENIKLQKDLLATKPRFISGAYAMWGDKPIDWDELVDPGKAPNGVIRADHPLVKLLSSSSRQPAPVDVTVKIGGKARKVNELQLAKDLSNMMVIDAINGQWDRFSGGNLQVTDGPQGVRIAVLDNGGTGNGVHTSYFNKFAAWVTRFDRRTAERLFAVHQFLAGKTSALSIDGSDFDTEDDLKRALGVYGTAVKDWEKKWQGAKLAIDKVVAHMESVPSSKRYFD